MIDNATKSDGQRTSNIYMGASLHLRYILMFVQHMQQCKLNLSFPYSLSEWVSVCTLGILSYLPRAGFSCVDTTLYQAPVVNLYRRNFFDAASPEQLWLSYW